MGRSVAVVVGVGKPQGLTPLPGALTGAADIAAWADECGFEVKQLTDADGPVRVADIYSQVEAAVDARDVERLVVFFAGHGVAKGTFDDFWLLSDGVGNPNESVNVPQSIALARSCGIPHVMIASDACRTMAGKDTRGVLGQTIFPFRQRTGQVEIDQLFAARSGDPSYEQFPDSDRERAFGLFTRELVDVLVGRHPRVLKEVDETPRRWAVTAFGLRDHLNEVVPIAASRLGLKQHPDIIPGSQYPPTVVCWLDHLPPSRPRRRGPRRGGPGGAVPIAPDVQPQVAARFAAEEGRDHFETETGLTVHGAAVARAAGRGVADVFDGGDRWHLRGTGEPSSVVIDVGDGRMACAAMLPGFVGSMHVGEHGVDFVSYQASGGSPYAEADPAETRAALAQLGAGLIAGIRDMAIDDANAYVAFLRQFKHTNPTFGIAVAYAYHRAGRIDQVRDLIAHFRAADQVVPFDVALLAGADPTEVGATLAPGFPMLTHGWTLLPSEAHEAVQQAATELAASTWATATGASGVHLFDAVDTGEVP